MKCSMAFLAVATALVPAAHGKETTLRKTTLVERELRVDQGDTLRLLPGVKLLFSEGVGLTVEGTLLAEGTGADPIVFSAAKPGVHWAGIRVAAGGAARLANASLLEGREGLRSSGGRVSIKSCTSSGCGTGIALEAAAEADVENLTVREASKAAFTARQGSRAALKGCTFSGPGGVGLVVTGRCEVTVTGSSFSGLEIGMHVSLPGTSPKIRNCRFEGNKQGVLTEFPECRPELTNCWFTKNGYGVHARKLSAPKVTGCEITGNEYGLYFTEGSAAEAHGCKIRGNAIGVCVNLSSYPTVNRCDLSGNTRYAVYLDVQSYEWVQANVDDGGQRQQQMMGMRAMAAGRRGALGSKPGPDTARSTNSKGGFVDFQQNYWGAEATQQMESSAELTEVGVIYDYFDKNWETYDAKRYARDKVDYLGYLSKSPFAG